MKINWRAVWAYVRSVLVTGIVAAIGVWIAQLQKLIDVQTDNVFLVAIVIAVIKGLQKLISLLYPGELTMPAEK